MSGGAFRYGFRIVGSLHGQRRLIDFEQAFAAHAACDARANVESAAYLSAFQFDDAFRAFLDETGSVREFAGACAAPWLWFDFDRGDELDSALLDARTLTLALVDEFGFDAAHLLAFFSGAKGFHVGAPCGANTHGGNCHKVARRVAERISQRAGYDGVRIDVSIYDKTRALRAPNSRHPRSQLHKVRLTCDELHSLPLDRVLDRARKPAPFELPANPRASETFAELWSESLAEVEREEVAHAKRASSRANAGAPARLNRATLEFVRSGAAEGDRHRMLFSAAANLAEYGCTFELAFALLSEAALDSGLPPAEVRRQVECGLAHSARSECEVRDAN